MAKAKKRVVKKAKAKKKGPVILPRKMSSLIRIALKDIRKAEASEKFVINMGEWYESGEMLVCAVGGTTVSEREVCVMCAAGSMMAFSLGLGDTADSAEARKVLNSVENHEQLEAVDQLRQGSVRNAAVQLGLEHSEDYYTGTSKFTKFDTNIPDYDNLDPEPFHKAMGQLQAKLQKAGL